MLDQILTLIDNFKSESFSGSIRIGIEKNKIVSVEREYTFSNTEALAIDFMEHLENICSFIHYGHINLLFCSGNVVSISAGDIKRGENLHNWIKWVSEKNKKCKSVKIAIKKSNGLQSAAVSQSNANVNL